MGPKHIFIIRHAQSIEDLDRNLYFTKQDSDLILTPLGHQQATTLADELMLHLGNKKEKIAIFSSPSKRVSLTVEMLLPSLKQIDPSLIWSESDLIKKQDWGLVNPNNREEIERERYKIGVLRYDFPQGEKANEFLSRTLSFVKNLPHDVDNVIIVTHGFMFRVLLMHLLNWSEDFFDKVAHPLNCEIKKVIITENNVTLDGDIRFVTKSKDWVQRIS